MIVANHAGNRNLLVAFTGGGIETDDANARLIAAAPVLFDCLQEIVLDAKKQFDCGYSFYPIDKTAIDRIAELLSKAAYD